MLQEMVMQKFKLEANAVINLSFKLSSFDFAVDITDDAEREVKGSILTPYKAGGPFLPLVEPEAASLPLVGVGLSTSQHPPYTMEDGIETHNPWKTVLLHHYGRFTSPPHREFVDELIATIDPVDIDTFSANQVKLILTNYVGYDKNSPTFIYIKKPNCSLDSGLVPFEDAIQERDTILMYTHHNRLHVYVSRVELSPLVVAELFRDETNKRENQGKPSCAKKLFD
ncbi:hypothetical protein Tco_0864380 [Tanacetum coccineum]